MRNLARLLRPLLVRLQLLAVLLQLALRPLLLVLLPLARRLGQCSIVRLRLPLVGFPWS